MRLDPMPIEETQFFGVLAKLLNNLVNLVRSETNLARLEGQDYLAKLVNSVLLKFCGIVFFLFGIFFISLSSAMTLKEQLGHSFSFSFLLVGFVLLVIGALFVWYLSRDLKSPRRES